MKAITAIGFAVSVSLASLPAFAAPKKMSDAQMDNVTGGLVTVFVNDLVDVNRNQVQVAVPVNANVGAQVGVLSGQALGQRAQQGLLGFQSR